MTPKNIINRGIGVGGGEYSTCKCRQGREVVVGGLIQLAELGTESLAQPFHHALDTRDVVVRGANE